MLAFFAILVGFTLVTFVWPFFALIRNRKSYEVSIQLTLALAAFFLAALMAERIKTWIGARTITFASLAMATGACFVLSYDTQNTDTDLDVRNKNAASAFAFTALYIYDNAIFGYLLICLSIAFLTIASLDEVLRGTENKLLRTKFDRASNMHLFVESAFMVYVLA